MVRVLSSTATAATKEAATEAAKEAVDVITTAGIPPTARARHWTEAIATCYFPLALTFGATDGFHGTLRRHTLGAVGLSRLTSDPLHYERRADHYTRASGADAEDAFLVTIPRTAPVHFAQFGREVTCPPGRFVIERGNAPYTFSYATRSDLIALKVSHADLSARLPRPEEHCAVAFDAASGAGRLLVDTVRLALSRWAQLGAAEADVLGEHILTLVALASRATPADEGTSDIAQAHLMRIEATIARHARDPSLTPTTLARLCGLSVRRLHALCSADGRTAAARIRAARLMIAHTALTCPTDRRTITAIAHASGFSDAAQFSRVYRAHHGTTPTKTRAARAHSSAPSEHFVV